MLIKSAILHNFFRIVIYFIFFIDFFMILNLFLMSIEEKIENLIYSFYLYK